MKYFINGYLFSQRQTGVMRYAKEILNELDPLVFDKYIELVVPSYLNELPKYKNIRVVKYGKIKGNIWEQISFRKYVKKHKGMSINFNNTWPYFGKGIYFIHDIAYKLHPEFGSSFYGKMSNIYHRILFRKAAREKTPIVTVSYFSKYQLVDFYHINPDRIHVISCAWQHMDRVGCDESVFKRFCLNKGEYYFSLGSVSKMKNTKWTLEVAKKNPNLTFVISGAKPLGTKGEFIATQNVIFTGFLKDEEIKSLIIGCKAFIYPSIYDGFGIPPLEAMSLGAKVICSSCASLAEVYGSTVIQIDAYDTDIDLDAIQKRKVADSKFALDKYSWKSSALKLYNLLYSNNGGNE